MRLTAIGRGSARAWERDRLPVINVARNNHRVHVRFPANRRRVPELSRHKSHRECDVAFRFRLALRRTEFGENGRGTQGSAPRPEVLRAVSTDATLQLLVD